MIRVCSPLQSSFLFLTALIGGPAIAGGLLLYSGVVKWRELRGFHDKWHQSDQGSKVLIVLSAAAVLSVAAFVAYLLVMFFGVC